MTVPDPSVAPWQVHWERLDGENRETLQLIALRVAAGMTYREIAPALAISEGEVARRMRDLRAAVRTIVDADDSQPAESPRH